MASYGNNYELNDNANDFFKAVQDIKDDLEDYNGLINRLQSLQSEVLNAVGTQDIESYKNQLENTTASISNLQQNSIKPKLQELYRLSGQDADKQKQAENLTGQFRTAIKKLASTEDNYKQHTKSRAMDQYKIVNPQASNEEAAEFVYNSGDQQIFDNAIRQSNRKGEAMTVLQEVQARHSEVERTERLAAELSQLFSDLQDLVFEQDIQFDTVNQNVNAANKDLERGQANLVKATEHAKKGRKLRWIIFWVVLILILIIVGVVVGAVVGTIKN